MKNHKEKVRDWAKVAFGLVIADILTGLWLLSAGLLPVDFWGVNWTPELMYLGIAFDLLLLLILGHYAWHPAVLEPTISRKGLFALIGTITGIVGLLHVYRLAMGLDFTIGSLDIPQWLSFIGAVVTLYISYASFHFMRR